MTALIALLAVGGGVYYIKQRPAPPPKDDSITQVAALARAEKEAELLQRAIREHHAILGMTQREVEAAKGVPQSRQKGDTLPEALRQKGGVENWVYELAGGGKGSVLFDANGHVIESSDVDRPPRAGQFIRQ